METQPEEQKAARVNWCQKRLTSAVWVFQGAEKPTKVIRSRSLSKKMVATFMSKAGHIATIPLNEQRTVTADWYTTICLPRVITELRKINPERSIIIHQDNASSHAAQKIRQYLTEENVELLDHPPYGPDLSPNDFFTLPKIKNRLRGQSFQSPEEAVDAFKNSVLDLPANEWNKCFKNWFERMQMCINLPSGLPRTLISDRQHAYVMQLWNKLIQPYGEAHVVLPSYSLPDKLCRWIADLLPVQMTEDLIWHEHISSIAAAAGKKLGYLFRANKVLPTMQGAAAPTTLSMLDAALLL
ncbi:unnamed protein product [Acanthoscelides obtectus]|uniref:Tc1-like transposase DDE domain-containing protein n=1 Tax=Acanthoscelides obtectus TaxID=200917 RepID=A0A9P0QA23_ACAOB|nr:unnamed protein product [Acanthoscelides obtectus]CAK1651330.1 Histone-lysine N-methyltransferase SETMAR [Acanthoscelides obtectus]